MSTHIFDEIINNKNTTGTYFSRFERLFFKKLKDAWDEHYDQGSENPRYLITERLVECFNEAKQEVMELKKRRNYALDN